MRDIQASVGRIHGRQCHNRIDDQQVIMQLLNEIPVSQGGTLMPGGVPRRSPPPQEGVASPELHEAILNFQRANQSRGLLADGHIDPGQKGIRVMNELASAPKERPTESTQFLLTLIADPEGSARAHIACSNQVGTTVASYQFTPKPFSDALARKIGFNRPRDGVQSASFQTPEPLTPGSFSGPVRMVDLVNTGVAAAAQFLFTANRPSGGQLLVSVTITTDPANRTVVLPGQMQLRHMTGSDRTVIPIRPSVRPLARR